MYPMGLPKFVAALGLCGFLILLADLVMIGLFIYKLACRRMSWAPLGIGAGAVVAGILGTIAGVIGAYQLVASKAGAANPADLSDGIGMALVDVAVGVGSLLMAMVLTGILYVSKRPEEPPEAEGPTGPGEAGA